MKPYHGLLKLARLLQEGHRFEELIASAATQGDSAYVLMRMAMLSHIGGATAQSWELQHEALQLQRHYRTEADRQPSRFRLLVVMRSGFMLDNTPLDFLLEDSSIACEWLYVLPDLPLPEQLPEHDAVFIAIGHLERNRQLFDRLLPLLRSTRRPIFNLPRAGFGFERHRLNELLRDIPGVVVPQTFAIARDQLKAVVAHDLPLPLIIRPLISQAGKALQRLLLPKELDVYLAAQPEAFFYVAPYVDYQSADGLYRKCRLLMLRGVPWVCHYAISSHWMVHFQTAGMEQDAAKREEEARFMATADSDFCHRHRAALAEIYARVRLDYFVIDCGETADGQLLFFEADNTSLVHATDSIALYPYKQVQMQKVFSAFRDMLGAP
ncbi:RimK family alpha-L-glutamate ligase [Duganella sp. FT80W]|uniref:RimK family alpha-L-glutamate ligase n=1 Tax=Duganella guangzhouensis TaxID=2666084 RepID=A0A6I2KY44_9BURK|nr:RimK family alpha-L-glutamate ligase [Duganella guangzhouensis]MRW89907.1 RimK family alpha-L-glutamate ligase [Duganella guangzhouensis]